MGEQLGFLYGGAVVVAAGGQQVFGADQVRTPLSAAAAVSVTYWPAMSASAMLLWRRDRRRVQQRVVDATRPGAGEIRTTSVVAGGGLVVAELPGADVVLDAFGVEAGEPAVERQRAGWGVAYLASWAR